MLSLDRFLQLSECIQSKKIPPRIGEANIDKEMKQALHDIQLCELEQLVQNFPVIMDKLIELLVTSCKIAGQQLTFGPAVFETMCMVSRMLGVSMKTFIFLLAEFNMKYFCTETR